MPLRPSIYDAALEPLAAYDFSRPLFVQASRQHHFDEVVDLLVHRLGLPPGAVTLLVSPTYAARPWMPYVVLRNPEPQLSDRTASLTAAAPPSVVVVTTAAPVANAYAAMRDHGNVACLCHAMEPAPVLAVTTAGAWVPARALFLVQERRFDGRSIVANFLTAAAETDALYAAALACPAGEIVEVGRFSGATAAVLGLAAERSGRPWIHSIDVEHLAAVDYFLARNGVTDRVQLIDADSVQASREWAARHAVPSIALLFIDADHTYDAVTRDLQAWLPHIVPGGTVLLHDVNNDDFGVSRAVYYHLRGRPDFGRHRQVFSTFMAERTSCVGAGACAA